MSPALLAFFAAALFAAAVVDWGAIARGVSRLTSLGGLGDRLGLRGEWDLELIGPDGVTKERRRFSNLIVNVGLDAAGDRLFNSGGAGGSLHFVAIGTDATPETAADVALGVETARAAGAFAAPSTAVVTVDHTFPAGTGTGAIAEVGMFDLLVAGTMYNRHTFAVINKLAGDTLKATCTITLSNV